MFKPTYTRAVGKQAAAEAQYDFGSHLAALTQECFGLKITDVKDVDIREAQTMSVTEMMVNQSAGLGDGSIPYARTKGLNGKGMNDPINMEEFGHLLTQCDGDARILSKRSRSYCTLVCWVSRRNRWHSHSDHIQ